MGSTQSNEEVIIAQNAAGGNNSADIQQLHQNVSLTNIILGIILIMLSIGAIGGLYKLYRKCHQGWMRQEIARSAFRRSGSRREARAPKDMHQGEINKRHILVGSRVVILADFHVGILADVVHGIIEDAAGAMALQITVM